jgi:hypothetical protein
MRGFYNVEEGREIRPYNVRDKRSRIEIKGKLEVKKGETDEER